MKTTLSIWLLLAVVFNTSAQTWSWSEDQLSYARMGLSATVMDDSIFYSGGKTDAGSSFLNIVNIYDIGEDLWSAAILTTTERYQISAVSTDSMVFFAGGTNFNAYDFVTFDIVDVYNKGDNEWSVEHLTVPKIHMGTVALANQVFFAGGLNYSENNPAMIYDVIDIYNTETGIWSTDYLSVSRWGIGAATAGGKVFFAGGATETGEVTDVVDVYDNITNEWSVIHLSEARAFTSAVACGNQIYFAGGTLPNAETSIVIDVYNIENGNWEVLPLTLSSPRIVKALNLNNALVFAGSTDWININTGYWGPPNGIVEVYITTTEQWDYSVSDLDPSRFWYGYASYENKAYYAGGWDLDQAHNIVNILEYDIATNISTSNNQKIEFQLYPNPFNSRITIDFSLQHSGTINITIYDNNGVQVKDFVQEYQQQGAQQIILELSNLKPGIYYCVLITSEGIHSTKMIKL